MKNMPFGVGKKLRLNPRGELGGPYVTLCVCVC